MSSVNLHGRVNLAHKDVASIEADGAGEAEEGVGDDEHVAKVHCHGHQLRKQSQFTLHFLLVLCIETHITTNTGMPRIHLKRPCTEV